MSVKHSTEPDTYKLSWIRLHGIYILHLSLCATTLKSASSTHTPRTSSLSPSASMTKDLARKPRFTRATASSNNQNDIYGLNGTSDMPMYSTLKALYDGQTWFGPQYARGLPGRKSIERFEAVKRLIEVYI